MLVRTRSSDNSSVHVIDRKETLRDSIELLISVLCSIGLPLERNKERKINEIYN